VEYLVRLTDRALRDLEAIFDFIQADTFERASAWFNGLSAAIYSLERFPECGAGIPEARGLRHLAFGKHPHVYRIIYAVDKRNRVVNVLHVRHGSRAPLIES